MTNGVEKILNQTPVSFDREQMRLTNGQRHLMDMLTTHLKEGAPITKDDIAECYLKATGSERIVWSNIWTSEGYRWGKVKEVWTKDHYRTRMNSMQWFKSNLGSCIIKGKLLAIPVIEMDEENQKITP